MKLAAAILFAVSNAQRGERQREKETPITDDAFASYFGDSYDYGNAFDEASYDAGAFGDSADAFGDLSFGDYTLDYETVDVAAIEDAVQADEASPAASNRPVSNNNDGKTLIPGDNTDDNDRTNAGFDSFCWINSGATLAEWAATSGTNAGRWHRCLGEGSACEVKVVRILSDNDKTTSVRQVTSKCANESSCIANMKQNFNPKIASAGNWYKQYLMQQCKPFGVGDRFKSNGERSSCVFCVEPCTESEQSTGFATGGCVGPSANGTPKGTVNAASIDVFDPATLQSNGAGNQYTTGNYYSTVTGTYTKNSVSVSLEVSTIQAAQLGTDFV